MAADNNPSTAMQTLADNRRFWLACNAVILLLHAVGVALYVSHGFAHPVAKLWAIVVMIHMLEFPLAFIAVRDRRIGWGTTIIATLVFGFTWWVPARRGIYNA